MRAAEAGSSLTDRELEILGAIAEGWSAKEAARILGIMPRTVECHLDTARMKLSARNRTHTVTLALAMGLLRHPAHRREAA